MNATDLDDQTSTIASPSQDNQSSISNRTQCSAGFEVDENGTNLCIPICGEFNPTSSVTVRNILEKVFTSLGFTSSVIIFVLALTVQRESR